MLKGWVSYSVSRWSGLCLVVAALLAAGPGAFAACGNGNVDAGEDCDDGQSQNGGTNSCCTSGCKFSNKSPDVIVGMLYGSSSTGGDLLNWGSQSGITAFSVGTKSCNVGSCWLNWFSSTAEHPVIGQSMYRLKGGRFEQIGQSWLKHGFTALPQNLCGTCVVPPNGTHLGVNCSDPYSSTLNGDQAKLGPKFQVNPSTGVFPYPFGGGSGSGALYKRLQVHNTDLDPAQNAGALYFVEGQYVTHDDTTAGNQDNNASYRRVTVSGSSNFTVTLQDSTVQESPAIKAWRDTDGSVTEVTVSAGDGIFILSAKATLLGAGVYHYEYALQNLNSDRAGQSFSVPIPNGAVVTNVGFHDVDYHSGEPYTGTDWTATVSPTSITWATQTYATNQNANALRWGTLYNFRFDANVPSKTATVTLGLFKPGLPGSISASTVTPGGCAAAANGTPCIDGSACTQTDTCQSGVCSGSNPVTCTASDSCHDVGTCSPVTGVCSNPAKSNGSACSDGNGCTQTDTCQSGVCSGSNPVTCTASDSCHDVGACSPATGVCSNPSKPDGTPCDDASICTADDACASGICAGTGPAVPGEVQSLTLAQSNDVTTLTWTPAMGATSYDVLRGRVSGLPVGPGGGDEVCLDDDDAGFSVTDTDDPGPDEAFWYLVNGENVCGKGPYGGQQASATCP